MKKEEKEKTTPPPLETIFSAFKPAPSPLGDTTVIKKVQEHLYEGPLEERTEYFRGEMPAIIFLKILADYDGIKSKAARAALNAISQCRISYERKGRQEDIQAIQSELQRQLEERRLEIERMKALTGERR